MNVNEIKAYLKRGFEPYISELETHKKACTDYDEKIAKLVMEKKEFIAADERINGVVSPICAFFDTLSIILSSEKAHILWDEEGTHHKLFFDVIDKIHGMVESSRRHDLVDEVITVMGPSLCNMVEEHISKRACVLTALYRSEDFVDETGDKDMFFTDVISIVNSDKTSHTYGLDCVVPMITKLDDYAAEENEDRDDHQYITKTFGNTKYISLKVSVKCFSIKKNP